MKKEIKQTDCCCDEKINLKKCHHPKHSSQSSPIFWPAILMFKLLTYLQM